MSDELRHNPANTEASPTALRKFIYHGFRIILGLIFILASYQKILMPWEFGRAVLAYELIPTFLVSPLVIIMPWVEMVTGVFLIINWKIRPSAILIALMNLIFIIAIISAMVRGMEIDCGCSINIGPLEVLIGTQADGFALVRDLIFIGMTAYIYTYADTNPRNQHLNERVV